MTKKTEWRMHALRADFREIGERLGIDPVMARILVNRGQDAPEKQERYLYGTLSDIPDPQLLKNCYAAAEILSGKIREGKKIRIISDYDVDGVTSCYVLLRAMECLGAEVSYDIPDRVKDGYGMNVRMVEAAAAEGVDTILTADNGTAAFEAVTRAKELGMTVIVTDHHQVQAAPQEEGVQLQENPRIQKLLPDADLIINPWQPGDAYPFKDICGVEVAYKLMQVLSKMMGKPLEPGAYMEFVALGTVCDVMPLKEENRIIVREGMRRMAATDNTGLRALMSVNNLTDKKINVYHLGFIIGPCINSEGRLSSAKKAMQLLLCKDSKEADSMAVEVKKLNESRKKATQEGVDWAAGFLEESGIAEQDHVIVLQIPELHESLAGIVAGKLRERYYRPVIVFTTSEDDPGLLKGSGRSIPEYDMFEALSAVGDMLERFGGHKMAAGLTIRKDMLESLQKRLNDTDGLTEEQLTEKVYIDVPMPLSYVNMRLAEQLEQLEPFGTGNQKPMFAERGLVIRNIRHLGKEGRTLRIIAENKDGKRSELITFNGDELLSDIKIWSEEEKSGTISHGAISHGAISHMPGFEAVRLDMMYEVSVNEFRGERKPECRLVYYRRTTED